MALPAISNVHSHVTLHSILRSRIAAVITLFIFFVTVGYIIVSYSTHTQDNFDYAQFMADLKYTPVPIVNNTAPTRPKPPHIKYSILDGFFLQSDSQTIAEGFDYRRLTSHATVLGLKNRPYDTDDNPKHDPNFQFTHQQGPRFEEYLRKTKESTPEDVDFKVFILGRHGEGWHNVAEAKYGTVDWDKYWSKHDNFTDPHLTPNAYMQAQDASAFWQSARKIQLIPTPESFYVSPLTRCLSTAMLTYSSFELPKSRPFHAIVKERLRETIGVHTCDRRSTRTYISSHFSAFTIEPGFTERDELWTDSHRETSDEITTRVKLLLDDIFNHDNKTIVSMTTHSGAIQAILEVVGHRPFAVQPGALLPVLVKAEWYGDVAGEGEQQVNGKLGMEATSGENSAERRKVQE